MKRPQKLVFPSVSRVGCGSVGWAAPVIERYLVLISSQQGDVTVEPFSRTLNPSWIKGSVNKLRCKFSPLSISCRLEGGTINKAEQFASPPVS